MTRITNTKAASRERRHRRVRARISGTPQRPRLAIYKSNTRLTAQLIDDTTGTTLAATSTATQKGKTSTERLEAAAKTLVADAQQKGVTAAVFDRGGFQYTGVIKTFADAVRGAGLTM